MSPSIATPDLETRVATQYDRDGLADRVLAALAGTGVDPSQLTWADLAPVDEFHVRGREATDRLMDLVAPTGDDNVLDVGAGIGGTARHLAATTGCRVTGLDLAPTYVDAANALTARCGLSDRVRFERGSALELPYHEATFDLVWTEHAQMNIHDKHRFYGEIARVLKPGGRLAFHDIFAGDDEPAFPVPWADSAELSALASPERARDAVEAGGLRVVEWHDTTAESVAWIQGVVARTKEHGPPPVGIHLLMGDSAPAKLKNLHDNLVGGRVRTVMAVAARTAS